MPARHQGGFLCVGCYLAPIPQHFKYAPCGVDPVPPLPHSPKHLADLPVLICCRIESRTTRLRIQPFTVTRLPLLWPLLTSARPSHRLGLRPCAAVVLSGQTYRSPGVRHNTFTRPSPDLPSCLPDEYRASESMAPLPRHAGLLSGSCSSSPCFASGFLPTIPHGIAVALLAHGSAHRGPQGTSTP